VSGGHAGLDPGKRPGANVQEDNGSVRREPSKRHAKTWVQRLEWLSGIDTDAGKHCGDTARITAPAYPYAPRNRCMPARHRQHQRSVGHLEDFASLQRGDAAPSQTQGSRAGLPLNSVHRPLERGDITQARDKESGSRAGLPLNSVHDRISGAVLLLNS